MIFRFFAISLALACFVFAAPALAQVKEMSEADKAVFAFFKLARGTPNYEQWIKNSDKYLSTDSKRRNELYEVENLRLKWGFGTYDINNDFIKVRTPVTFILSGTENNGTLSFAFAGGVQEVPYFPFPYGKEWIAFIINDLAAFMTVKLTPEEFRSIQPLIGVNAPHQGHVVLHMRAVKADKSKPIQMDGLDQWLMLGETGQIEMIYDAAEGAKILWSFMAPWYLTDAEKELYPLLEK